MVKRVIIGFGILNLLAFLLVFKKPYKKQRYKNMIVRLFVVILLISMVSHQQL